MINSINKNLILSAIKLWNYHKLNFSISKSEYILGLGSYDIRIATRCGELYSQKVAKKIIFSGKFGNWTKGKFIKTEAETFAEHAMLYGVSEEDILIEKKSTNLGENIKFTQQILFEKNIEPKKIIVVTKPNTERRAYATFKKIWPEIEVIITSPTMDIFQQTAVEFCNLEALMNEMVGDLQRIERYPDLGFQIAQEIPPEIWETYNYLIASGYDKHLLCFT